MGAWCWSREVTDVCCPHYYVPFISPTPNPFSLFQVAAPRSAAAAAARRRAKPKEMSELEIYKKLLAGDWKGFLASAWNDVLMVIIGIPYCLLLLTDRAQFLRPVREPRNPTLGNHTNELALTLMRGAPSCRSTTSVLSGRWTAAVLIRAISQC